MRRVVVVDDFREAQIRPDSGFSHFIELLKRDFAQFIGAAELVELDECPACGQEVFIPDFEKMGVQYVRCQNCQTSFVSPRPTMDALDSFYAQAEAIRYWNTTLSQSTAPARRQYIFAPRAAWVAETASRYGPQGGVVLDAYTKYPAYLEELGKRGTFTGYMLYRPTVDVGEVQEKLSAQIVDSLDPAEITLISAFEVIERLFDPFAFMKRLREILEPGGLVLITTLSISGFDLRILRDKARNLLPPNHLTLLSYQGIHEIITRSGFEMLELSTPGQLDVALVMDALNREPSIKLPAMIDSILLRRGEPIHQAFQDFLQRANLSSHVWIAARKKGS